MRRFYSVLLYIGWTLILSGGSFLIGGCADLYLSLPRNRDAFFIAWPFTLLLIVGLTGLLIGPFGALVVGLARPLAAEKLNEPRQRWRCCYIFLAGMLSFLLSLALMIVMGSMM